MPPTRTERDSMGSMEVPANAYYGAQTERARRNFEIGGARFPRPVLRALGLVKKSAARVNAELGLLDEDLARLIEQAAGEVADGKLDDQFPLVIYQTGSGTSTNMNANEVVAGRANELAGGERGGRSPVHPNDAVNMGQSSNDVIPTAIHLSAREEIERRLIPALERLRDALAERAGAFDGVVKIGRTHLQDAVPIRLGQEFSGYASQVEHGVRRARGASEALAEIPIGGTAVGTGVNTHAEFPERMAAALSREVGLIFAPASNYFEAMANRDAAVEASSMLRTIAVSLSNIANNVRLLACGPRCGIGEIRVPELQPGSSIMPAKVNPVIPEAVMMVAARVIGNDATIAWSDAMGSDFDLNVMMPVMAHALLESIELLAAAADHLTDKCVDAREFLADQKAQGVTRIEADEERCREHVEQSLALCTALAPRVGYDNASALAKTAYREGATVREVAHAMAGLDPEEIARRLGEPASADVLREHGGFPATDEVDRLLDPRRQTERGSTGGAGG
ncbi:class II fumarate hydratase [Paludisphaera sp.]|uniref:class II fumarate hydratase n=1 Tax=Paludisphaera sp. TaxID=2017432 RepID=UPI00301C537B